METRFHIGEIASFFEIPASTLRYWEECGVLSPEKSLENQYRTYSIPDLMTISDVLFYKNLGIPLKQIRDIEKNTPDQQKQLLENKMEMLIKQQQAILQRLEKLRNHLTAVNTLQELKKVPYHITDIDSQCIVSFELVEKDKLRQYIKNPYLYSRVQHSNDIAVEQRGLTISREQEIDFPPDQILWQKTGNRYAVFLMREEVTIGFPNDLQKKLAEVQKTYRTGSIISRFLLCGQENGKVYDFYKTYVELLQSSHVSSASNIQCGEADSKEKKSN